MRFTYGKTLGMPELMLLPIVVAAPIALLLEYRRRTRSPGTRAFTWGMFVGVSGLWVSLCGLLLLIGAPFFGKTPQDTNEMVFAGFGLTCAYGISGFFVIKRRKWAWITLTVLFWNPIIWIAHYRYGANRWEEFERERSKGAHWTLDLLGVLSCGIPLLVMGLAFSLMSVKAATGADSPRVSQGFDDASQAKRLRTDKSIIERRGVVPRGTPEASRTVVGIRLPYRIQIPNEWAENEEGFGFDRSFRDRTGLRFDVSAHAINDKDTAEVKASILARLPPLLGTKPVVSSERSVLIANHPWLMFQLDYKNGNDVESLLYFVYAGPEGTFKISAAGNANVVRNSRSQIQDVALTFTFPSDL